MTTKSRNDLTLPLVGDTADRGPRGTSIAAFVPITLALIGVGAILFGGLSASDPWTAVGSIDAADPITTGSIAAQPSGMVAVTN